MLKLTLNEEKVRKILLKHPYGVKAITIKDEADLSRSPTYKALKRLEQKGLAFRGGICLYFPENPLRSDMSLDRLKDGKSHEESKNKLHRLGFYGWLVHRSEQQIEKSKRLGAKAEFMKELYKLRLKKHGEVTMEEELDLKKRIKEDCGLKYCL